MKEYLKRSSPKYLTLDWLKPLSKDVEKIVNFGCRNSLEPFVLLDLLEANEVSVVEKEPSHLTQIINDYADFREDYSRYFQSRHVNFLNADMTNKIDKLPSDYFHLAYCENVLYQIHLDSSTQGLQDAIDEMIRVVKPRGYIIAYERKIGAESGTAILEIFGTQHEITKPTTPPMNISPFFESTKVATLKRINLANAPDYSYCYQKLDGH